MEYSAHDEVAWSLMDFGPTSFTVDRSTAADRDKVVVDHLIVETLKNRFERTAVEVPTDLMGLHYL